MWDNTDEPRPNYVYMAHMIKKGNWAVVKAQTYVGTYRNTYPVAIIKQYLTAKEARGYAKLLQEN